MSDLAKGQPSLVRLLFEAVHGSASTRSWQAAVRLYRSTPPYRSKQKQDLCDLPRERRFIPTEPFEHISIEMDQALETKRQDSRRIKQRVART
jgi:hypothetical protein